MLVREQNLYYTRGIITKCKIHGFLRLVPLKGYEKIEMKKVLPNRWDFYDFRQKPISTITFILSDG